MATFGNPIVASPNLLPSTADVFSTSEDYKEGKYVYYGGKLYRFTTDHAAGAWDGTDAIEVKLANDLTELGQDLSEVANVATEHTLPFKIGRAGYYVKQSDGDLTNNIAGFDATDYIDVSGYEYIVYKRIYYTGSYSAMALAFYTDEKVFVSSIGAVRYAETDHYELLKVSVPPTAKYVRASMFSNTAYGEWFISGGPLTYRLLDVLDEKANVDGYYDTLTAGNAEQLVSTVGVEDMVPYNFRTSGGSADIGDREVDEVIGGTLAWNQMVPTSATATTHYDVGATIVNGVCTYSGTASATSSLRTAITIGTSIPGHIYLAEINDLSIGETNTGNIVIAKTYDPIAGIAGPYAKAGIYKEGSTAQTIRIASMELQSGDVYDATFTPQVFDLTLMFGFDIADFINSLETATAGAGVAWFRKLFPNNYYAYDAGTLRSVNVSAHKMVGFNAYNHTIGMAKLVGGMNYQITGAYTALSYSTGETIEPDGSGYFVPTLSGTLTVTGGNATTTCVHLVWDGERDGEWEEYTENSYPLDDSLELRGLAKLNSNNELYFDGDTYESDGTVTVKFHKPIDLSALTWTYHSNGEGSDYKTPCFTSSKPATPYSPTTQSIITIVCSKYVSSTNRVLSSIKNATLDKRILWDTSNNRFCIFDSDYSDAESLTTALSGHYATYKVVSTGYVTNTAEPYQNPQIVDDFGTEEYVDASVAAGTRDVSIPVGHDTHYQANLRAKLEMAPDSPDGDGDYLVRQTDGINAYVPYLPPDAGDVEYDSTEEYDEETVGYEINDIKGDVTDIENIISQQDCPETILGWEKGSYNSTSGENYTENNYIRNQTFVGLPFGTRKITCAEGYVFLLFAWNANGAFVGSLKSGYVFDKTTANYLMLTEYDCTLYPTYQIKITMRRNPASTDITPDESGNCVLIQSTDKTLTLDGKPADAKTVGQAIAVVKEFPAAPTTDGTYVLKVTVADGEATYSWVAET